MEQWFVPPQMIALSGQTVKNYGYDTRGVVDYSFNSRGFRSGEPSTAPRLAVIGNSISFGIGLDASMTYSAQLAQLLGRTVDNYSFACYAHENHDHLTNMQLLAKQDQDSIFLIQINNLDRRRNALGVYANNDPSWCIDRFNDFFEQTEELLKGYQHHYIYWDNVEYELSPGILKKIVIKNKFHLDHSLAYNTGTFGAKSHYAIAKALSYTI